MKKMKYLLASLMLLSVLVVPVGVSALPALQFAASCAPHTTLGFPSWYNGLQCEMVKIDGATKSQPELRSLNDIWVIVLNIIEWFIIAGAYIAGSVILWGGIKYMRAQGEPGKITEAKSTILNAVMGLGIALLSTAIVQFIQGAVK